MKKLMFFALILLLSLQGCQKDQLTPVGPSIVEYMVTSTTSLQAAELSYINETGASTTLKKVNLPFYVKISRPQGAGTSLLQAYLTTEESKPKAMLSLSGQIIVDGKIVKIETSTSEEPYLSIGYAHLPK